jgi:anti-sigma regulatory factor (Ser/Thr protein kinase)
VSLPSATRDQRHPRPTSCRPLTASRLIPLRARGRQRRVSSPRIFTAIHPLVVFVNLASPMSTRSRSSCLEQPLSDTHTVTLADKAARKQVVSAAAELARATTAGTDVELDLTGLSEIDATWGAVLSNVLVGGLRNARNVHVHMPDASTAHAQMARAGLYFALARHQGLDLSDSRGWEAHLTRWRKDWHPINLQEPLFNLVGERIGTEEPDPFDDQLLAFLNPDRQPPEDTPRDQEAVVYPWLRTLMKQGTVGDSAAARDLHHRLSVVTWELLDNIRDHALLPRDGQSSLATFATRGRPNRLHICVMDTGVGIPSSLRSRLDDDSRNDKQLLTAALKGELPKRGRDRGHGFERIVSLISSQHGGRLFLASGPTADGGAIVAECSAKSAGVKVEVEPNVKMNGTVALVTLPFGPARPERSTIARTVARGTSAEELRERTLLDEVE